MTSSFDHSPANFLVVDTEGKDCLREIAVINGAGEVIYEAFAQEHPDNDQRPFNVKPLKQVLQEFFTLAQSHWIVFHSATHDLQVLRNSCYQTGVNYQNLQTICTVELARQRFAQLPSYSLEYLSRKLSLKVKEQFFSPDQAHTARYDALFTYQLYLILRSPSSKTMLALNPALNPFSSSRVDNPFQDHIDLKTIYQAEFEQLKWLIQDIRQDKNHQSKGVVIIGEPGSGKTHLMMRLAKELLKVNRLLFIRHPNNPESVLYHIYSRILESFVYKIPDTHYTQLEFLLAHSFVKLISHTNFMTLTQKDQDIRLAVQDNPLDLYEKLGSDDTQRKKAYWEHIEKRTNEWWMSEYGIAGYAPKIIKGIIKFCRYSDRRYKELVTRWLAAEELTEQELTMLGLDNWNEEMSKEAFSLEAIAVFSKLSLLDEPLIIIFDQLELLGLKQNEKLLLSFGEAVKEIFTHVPNSLIILNLFPDRWQQFQQKFDASIVDRISQYQLALQRPTNEALKEILILKMQGVGLELHQLFTATELEQILAHSSIRGILNSAAEYYLSKVYGRPLSSQNPLLTPPETIQKTVEQRLEIVEKELQTLKNLWQQMGQIFTGISFSASVPEVLATVPNPQLTGRTTEQNRVQQFLVEHRSQLAADYEKLQIITDSDDLGKLKVILEAWQLLKGFSLDYLRLGKKRVPEHLVIKQVSHNQAIAFLNLEGSVFTSRIKNFNELVILHKDTNFLLWRDQRKLNITGKVGREEIEKLNNAANGQFCLMEKEDRLGFELLYQLVTDIYNRDLEVSWETAWSVVNQELADLWLLKVMN
jgi:DNA polymerase III epsilon subunit-like protein